MSQAEVEKVKREIARLREHHAREITALKDRHAQEVSTLQKEIKRLQAAVLLQPPARPSHGDLWDGVNT